MLDVQKCLLNEIVLPEVGFFGGWFAIIGFD